MVGLRITPASLRPDINLEVNDYHQKCAQERQGHNDPPFLYNLIIQATLNHGQVFLGYQENSPNPKSLDTHNVAYHIGMGTAEEVLESSQWQSTVLSGLSRNMCQKCPSSNNLLWNLVKDFVLARN